MSITAWDEPAGGTPRGTLILLPGRGETAASYARFGRRISADAWKVRLVPVDLNDLEHARTQIEKLLADSTLPGPKVLIGSDSGATFAAHLADEVPADAVILAGSALPSSSVPESWDQELDARSACPVHRSLLTEDPSFQRGALAQQLPWSSIRPPAKPFLALHGAEDTLTPPEEITDQLPRDQVRLVRDGHHDVLNDASHRAVAATVILFLESLRLGPDLPPIIR
ncbi:alpha/beta hydrolase [Kineosporia babensis]|uniref:Alpha/beta hydrolase n=1 Tax=Kineosporia babensis TaxID=499548 RepID=A0A9X1SXB5_9ACTN|nr:alpha/beta hydrolase [Kineosporia babensis]MCD5316047.1 alpha/beta hydrolase [Kineosporia babensis]